MPRYVNGLVTSGERGRNSPVGRMFIQPLIENAHGRPGRLDDTLGPWFAVLGFGADPAEHLTDAQHATRFVVIRPDRYVAAQADETSLGAAIDRLRGLLEPGATEAGK